MRIVDIDPLIRFFESSIDDLRKSNNGLGVRIYSYILDGLMSLPVIDLSGKDTTKLP